MKITNFNAQSNLLSTIRSEMNEALKAVADKYGINIHAGNATYNAEQVNFKLVLTTKGENGEVETVEAKDFKKYAELYGFKKEDLGRSFKMAGAEYIITGWKNRSNNKLIAKKVGTTNSYKLNSDLVKTLLSK